MQILSKSQKSKICQLVRHAWDARPDLREPLLEANLETMSKTDIFNAWRHVEQGKAVGRQSLTQCTSEGDFLKLCAHFRALAGDTSGAARTIARHETEPRRVARWKLEQECRKRGVDLGYAAAICRTQNKCSLDEASEKQLWRLVFTVKSRRKAARSEKREAAAKAEDPF